jgi:hypothetical protein
MNVFIVEDGLQTRKELADLSADEKGFSVVGEVGSVRESPIRSSARAMKIRSSLIRSISRTVH